jgi:hypothetical protein
MKFKTNIQNPVDLCRLVALLLLLNGSPFHVIGQNSYELDLKPELWNIHPHKYFLAEVRDARTAKDGIGKITNGTPKKVNVTFRNDPEKDLAAYFHAAVPPDTSLVPLLLVIDKLEFTETGYPRRTLTLKFKVHIAREADGKEIELFRLEGNPYVMVQGDVPRPCEKLLEPVLKQVMENFDQWVEEHPNQTTLCKMAIPVFEDDSSNTDYLQGDTIRWNDTYHLNWSDFQGKVPSGTDFSAQSDCQFSFGATPEYDQLTLKIRISLAACFVKSGSWAKESDKRPELLAHEQLHFAICEWYLRQLKEEIRNTTLSLWDSEQQLKKLFSTKWNEYLVAQDAYDEETQHGIIKEKQQEWEEKVMRSLKEIKK